MPVSTTAGGLKSPKLRQRSKAQKPEILDLFNDFNTFNDPSLVKALKASMNFCLAMASSDIPAYWLTLLGPSGVGKTMLARKCAQFFRLIENCRDERCQPTEDYNRHGGFKRWSSVVNDMLSGDYSGIRHLKEDWFLALDDIGTEYERNKELCISKLYDIFSERAGVFTVITCNLSLQEINSRMDARIASRLLRDGNIVIDVTARDFNLR